MKILPASTDLKQLRKLYEVRERRALSQFYAVRAEHSKLCKVRDDIQACVDGFQDELNALDNARAGDAAHLTAVALIDEAEHRSALSQHLQREKMYLQTAQNDVLEKDTQLSAVRGLWKKQRARLVVLEDIKKRCEDEQQHLQSKEVEKQIDELVQHINSSVRYG